MIPVEGNDTFAWCSYLYIFREEHPESVLTSMQTIMVLLLEESEDVPEDLLMILLSKLGPHKKVRACTL